jgi:HAD superfamily hydrolase (TIGR01509 family)
LVFRHVIFDCDGVLVDSEPLSMKLDQQLLAENGVNLSEDEVIERFVGLTFGALIARVKIEFGIELPNGISDEKDRRLLALYEHELVAAEGAKETLASIALPKSVASNSPRTRVEAAIRITGLGRWLDGFITTFEDVRAGKPAPDIYLLAAARAGFMASQCLVVEDSRAGVTAAVAAGLPGRRLYRPCPRPQNGRRGAGRTGGHGSNPLARRSAGHSRSRGKPLTFQTIRSIWPSAPRRMREAHRMVRHSAGGLPLNIPFTRNVSVPFRACAFARPIGHLRRCSSCSDQRLFT